MAFHFGHSFIKETFDKVLSDNEKDIGKFVESLLKREQSSLDPFEFTSYVLNFIREGFNSIQEKVKQQLEKKEENQSSFEMEEVLGEPIVSNIAAAKSDVRDNTFHNSLNILTHSLSLNKKKRGGEFIQQKLTNLILLSRNYLKASFPLIISLQMRRRDSCCRLLPSPQS